MDDQEILQKVGGMSLNTDRDIGEIDRLVAKMKDASALNFIIENYKQEPTDEGEVKRKQVVTMAEARLRVIGKNINGGDIRLFLQMAFTRHGEDDQLSKQASKSMPDKIYTELLGLKGVEAIEKYYRELYAQYPKTMGLFFKKMTNRE